MELNREQIIKALERLASEKDVLCKVCAYQKYKSLAKDTLSLIKQLTEENERLRAENEIYAELEQGCYVTGVKKVQADTVRKMQERLKKEAGYFGRAVAVEVIDQIAKEMLEGEK